MMRVHDTIAALATPLGTSALAVLRVSGPLVAELAQALFEGGGVARQATHADYRDREGALLDDVLFTRFVAPFSYTGEDALEISCHGNPYIAQRILEDLFSRGCRPAEPGEFTQRAFLGGKMDLTQAEAVMDLIHARSERSLLAAQQQLRGSLGRHMEELCSLLLDALAQVEAYIDFPEEDLPAEDRLKVLGLVESACDKSCMLLSTNNYGDILRGGLKVVIVGEPNAGKSSLLNRLVGRERALVSPEPGTTRDFIEECVSCGPHLIRLTDTAGLNAAPQALERLGMEKTLECVEQAGLLLVVLDPARPTPPFPEAVLRRVEQGEAILVVNKMDLGLPMPQLSGPFNGLAMAGVSSLQGIGIEELKNSITGACERLQVSMGSEVIAINARHADALKRALAGLEGARGKLAEGQAVELLASDLRSALDACGEISGRIDNERMLDRLFSTFCIGK